MPNPYHDAEGKFTSRQGMLKAIDHAAVTGDTETYIRLRKEMDEIEATVVHIEETDIANLLNRKRFATTTDEVKAITSPQLLDVLVNKVVADKKSYANWDAYNDRLADCYHHPQANDEIRNKILASMDEHLAVSFINHENIDLIQQKEIFRKYAHKINPAHIEDFLGSGKINANDVAETLRAHSAFSTLANIATPELWETPAGKEMFAKAIRYPVQPENTSYVNLDYIKPTVPFLKAALKTLPDSERRVEAMNKMESVGVNPSEMGRILSGNPHVTGAEMKNSLRKTITSGGTASMTRSEQNNSSETIHNKNQ